MRILAKAIFIFTCSLLFAGAATADSDLIVKRNAAKNFVTLPDGVHFPEGITANQSGKIFVGTFDFGGGNKLLRYSANGKLEAIRDFGATPLLGLKFNPGDNKVYICNFGASKIQRIAANFNAATPVEDVADIPGIGAPPSRTEGNPDGSMDTIIFGSNSFPAPNALAFDSSGYLYVSDSFQGAIFRIDNVQSCDITTPCVVNVVKHDGLLATAGFPPFGANGLAFNADESAFFVANTGDDRVLRLDLITDALSVFAESINGADGLSFDSQGRLWVAANQADEVVALDDAGRVIAKLGDFQGIRRDGTPRGLLFPASLVIVNNEIFVTNLALPLTDAVGDESEEDVTRYTISRMKIPESGGGEDD